MPMRDSHRMFLQSVMTKGIMIGREVKPLYRSCCLKFNEDAPEEGLAEFIIVINNAIKPYHLEIRKGVSEDTGVHCYCLVNTKESGFMKVASDYKENELEFFKKLVEGVVESETGTVSSIDALNLVEKVERMNKQQLQEVLNRFEEDKWLQKTQGEYSLSPRAILELEQFLFEQFPDSTTRCNMCKRICLQGQCCGSDTCEVKIHLHCAYTYFKNKATKTCPGADCSEEWTHDITPPKSTKSAEGGDKSPQKTRQRETRKRKAAADSS